MTGNYQYEDVTFFKYNLDSIYIPFQDLIKMLFRFKFFIFKISRKKFVLKETKFQILFFATA